MMKNKKAMSTGAKLVIGIIVALLTAGFIISINSDSFGKVGVTIDEYSSKADFDNDGLPDSIDTCPCDRQGSLSSKAYLLKSPLPDNQKLLVGNIDRINKEDAEIIADYLREESVITKLYLSQELNDEIKDLSPDKNIFCVHKITNGEYCTYADFKYDFFEKDSISGFAEICSTKKEFCKETILARYEEEKESSEEA